jgi:hypothetical protein
MLVLLASIVLADLLQGSTLNSKQNAKHNTTRTHNTTLRESDVARVLDKLACDRGVLWLVLVLWLVVPETFITFITSFATLAGGAGNVHNVHYVFCHSRQDSSRQDSGKI